MHFVHALEHETRHTFPPSLPTLIWPLTSVAYNKNCLDQSHLPHKTFQTRQSQIAPLPYPFPRWSHHPRVFRKRWESPQSQTHSLRRMRTPPDFIAIDSAKSWVLITGRLSTIASTKMAGGKGTGSDGDLTSLIGNGSVIACLCLIATLLLTIDPPGNRQRRLFWRRRCLGTLPP